MGSISLNDFRLLNYNSNGISNFKLINGICTKCNSDFSYSTIYKFIRNRINKINKKHLWDTCQKCWHLINTVEDQYWMENNSKIQSKIQSSEEQKRKNSIGVSKSWTHDRRKKTSEWLKERWKNDDKFRKKALNNLQWTQINDNRRDKILKGSLGKGGLKGIYNDIYYDSALELSYILYCIDNQIEIIRYNIQPIHYLDENKKDRVYIPDFIINNDTIIEIKGYGIYYQKNYERSILKIESLKSWSSKNGFKYQIIFNTEDILKKNYKKARKIHHENKNKKDF
jgi:hypothetical protein